MVRESSTVSEDWSLVIGLTDDQKMEFGLYEKIVRDTDKKDNRVIVS